MLYLGDVISLVWKKAGNVAENQKKKKKMNNVVAISVWIRKLIYLFQLE